MKNLFGVFFCLLAAVAAQQAGESKSPGQPAPPSAEPSADILVRALLAADKVRNKQEKLPAEELKTLINREIAKSATLPSVQMADARQGIGFQAEDLMVTIDGAVYLKFGGTIYPMPGGGASGCFDPNSTARLEQARLKFAGQAKSDSGKKE
ncbi:MAG TPA: hypothetical protein VGB07_26370 [Blastocatellia bacterium]|jgi:hypothetical protein